MDSLIKEIKKKKEFQDLPDSLVENSLKNYITKNRILQINSPKSVKLVVKAIRSELRRYSGQYSSLSKSRRNKLISQNDTEKLLKSHSSTRERIEDYFYIKNLIKKLNPKSILDLGCGLNPIALAEKNISYYAYDIKNQDIETVSEFFNKNKIDGFALQADITTLKEFPQTDLCLIFKVLDILPGNRYENSKSLISQIKSEKIIVSFATHTLSGKPMNSPKRFWFENLLKELNLSYKTEKSKNEIFYLIINE